jgi:hypothetical protein
VTYQEAVAAIEGIRERERQRLERDLARLRGPDGMIPRDERPLQERIESMVRESVENPILFHREIKKSRRKWYVSDHHPDGRLRWVRGFPIEGGPNHPHFQAALAAADLITDEELAADDWTIKSYDPLDF